MFSLKREKINDNEMRYLISLSQIKKLKIIIICDYEVGYFVLSSQIHLKQNVIKNEIFYSVVTNSLIFSMITKWNTLFC